MLKKDRNINSNAKNDELDETFPSPLSLPKWERACEKKNRNATIPMLFLGGERGWKIKLGAVQNLNIFIRSRKMLEISLVSYPKRL